MSTKLTDLIGCTYKQKIIDDAFRILIEEKRRMLGSLPTLNETALVIVHTSEILGIGGSDFADTHLDNFGAWFAALMVAPGTASSGATMKRQSDGASKTVYDINTSGSGYLFDAGSTGTRMQVGKGSYQARSDYAINSAFTTAPESGQFNTGTGSYSAGTITVSGSITSGGSGTISEAMFFGYWYCYTDSTTELFALCHDNVSPTVPFSAGQSITCQYSWTV